MRNCVVIIVNKYRDNIYNNDDDYDDKYDYDPRPLWQTILQETNI